MIRAICLTALLATAAFCQSNEEKAVRVPLESYLQGHATGDPNFIRASFEKNAKIQGFRSGAFTTWSVEEYSGLFTGKAAADEASRKRWIQTVEITGNAASAKLMFDYPTSTIVDYMLLLKINGEWKIVNKIFHGEAKQK